MLGGAEERKTTAAKGWSTPATTFPHQVGARPVPPAPGFGEEDCLNEQL